MAPFLHLDVIGLAELSALLCQQEGNLLGQLLGGMNGHRLVSSQLPAHYLDLPLGNLELFGQVFDEMAIGLAIYRRGSDGQFELIAVQALKLVAAGLGLDIEIQPQGVTLLAQGHQSMLQSGPSRSLSR